MTQTVQPIISIDIIGRAGVSVEEFVSATGNRLFAVRCFDYVINEWIEVYETLAIALARVAVLAECVESDDTLAFARESVSFAHKAKDFIESEVTPI